jgi:ectoine hydroxylase-related dioxygenase (phytanoyl-CoA dioxygenase family)
MSNLTAAELQELERSGFVTHRNLVSTEEAETLRTCITRLFNVRAGYEEGAYGELTPNQSKDHEPNSPQIHNPVNYAPELHQSNCFKGALTIAKQILGPSAHFFTDIAILKHPRHGAPTPWHQDEAFRDPRFTYREVTIWVALQDVDETSGCLKFVPGTHNTAVRMHRAAGGDIESLALECVEDSLDGEAGVTCPIPAGACTVHFPRTLHCSLPNVSGRPRIGYAMTFGLDPEPATTPVAFPWLDNRIPEVQARRTQWMQHGGWAITGWRRLRRGELRGWRTFRYWASRTVITALGKRR